MRWRSQLRDEDFIAEVVERGDLVQLKEQLADAAFDLVMAC